MASFEIDSPHLKSPAGIAVAVVVAAAAHFEFRSTVGGWRLVKETAPPLLDRIL